MSDVNNFNQGEQQNNGFNQQPTNEYGQQPANDYSQQSFGYTGAPVVQEEKKGMSIASLVLGICGFIAWCIPLIGYPVTILGIIFGAVGMKKGGKKLAIAGIICSAITLVFTLINSIAGAMMATQMLNSLY